MFRAGAMRNDDKKTGLILSVCGIVPVIWLALMTAPYVGGGLVEIIRGLPVAMGNARECVREVCKVNVADHDHGGCAEAIYRYLLGGQNE